MGKDVEIVKYLRRGIVIWATDVAGNPVRVLCQPNGTLLVAGVVTVAGPVVIINDMAPGQFTTTPLAGGATYTSGIMVGDGYRRITGSVTANVAGTLYVEQSPNGINWDVSDAIAVAAGATLGFCVEVCCPSLRIRYVNGGAAQATFRLYSFLRTI